MKPIVVKIGGSTLGSHDTAIEDIAALHAGGRRVVVVHGGGNAATEWLTIHGIESEFVNGLRVTTQQALEVVTAVFSGLVNKDLVAQLLARGVRAAGISGVDGATVGTRQAGEPLGFVGEVTSVDTGLLESLLRDGFLPVLAPISYLGDRPGQIMNVNADTVAGEVARGLGAGDLVFLTDVPAVKDASGEWASRLTTDEAQRLVDEGTAGGGMAPKLQACIKAARAGVTARIVDGREPHALRAVVDGAHSGTTVTA